MPDRFCKQLFLGIEVKVNGALGNARPLGYIIQSGSGIPIGREYLQRRLEDFTWPFFLAS